MRAPDIKSIQTILLISCALMSLWACSGESEAEVEDRQGFFTAIYTDQMINAELAFDLDSVNYYKRQESENEVQGTFTLQLDTVLQVPVEIRSRGVTRKSMCPFPPLRVQLKKKAAKAHNWGDFRNYKLVTHCADSLKHEELLFREYLVYKMYEELTDISLRAQLLDVSYVTPGDTVRRHGILIENEEEMNHRLGLEELDIKKQNIQSIHFDHYKKFVLFQYMVGNTDWNLGTGHNTKYVLESGTNTPIVIPYDFDYCGLVNASYARPFSTLPIENVRERHFMYRGKKQDDFSAAIEEFKAKKQVWLGMVKEFPYLTDEGKTDIEGFLMQFFDLIESPDWKDQAFPS